MPTRPTRAPRAARLALALAILQAYGAPTGALAAHRDARPSWYPRWISASTVGTFAAGVTDATLLAEDPGPDEVILQTSGSAGEWSDSGVATDGGAATLSATQSDLYGRQWLNHGAESWGGAGGGTETGQAGRGGDADTFLALSTDAIQPWLYTHAYGGSGGSATNGLAGDGGNARAESALTALAAGGDAYVAAEAYGGRGGDAGPQMLTDAPGSLVAQQAGRGGDAVAVASGSGAAGGYLSVTGIARGGAGGTGWDGVSGGDGGSAQVSSVASATDDATGLSVRSTAQGGAGGQAWGGGATGGRGADVGSGVSAAVVSNGFAVARADVAAYATGGDGGAGYTGANGGQGGSATLVNAVSVDNAQTLLLNQTATGGNGGSTYASDGLVGEAGSGGDALSRLVYHWLDNTVGDGVIRWLSVSTSASGGAGGNGIGDPDGGLTADGGAGGSALASLVSSAWHDLYANLYSTGGSGGYSLGGQGGRGGDANGTMSLAQWAIDAYVEFSAYIAGGNGGVGDGGTGGHGGSALLSVAAQWLGLGTDGLQGSASSTGGAGGTSNSSAGVATGGGGGAASLSAWGSSNWGALYAAMTGYGGAGGDSTLGDGGDGGSATASLSGNNDHGSLGLAVSLTGGHGGYATGNGYTAGNGGSVTVSDASVVGSAATNLSLAVTANGGIGGSAYDGARAGDGGFASVQAAALQGSSAGTLSFTATAAGGQGGDLYSWGSGGGAGGSAVVQLTVANTQASALNAVLNAYGGNAGILYAGQQVTAIDLGAGGAADLQSRISGVGDVNVNAGAYGGRGGTSAVAYGDYHSAARGGNGGDATGWLNVSSTSNGAVNAVLNLTGGIAGGSGNLGSTAYAGTAGRASGTVWASSGSGAVSAELRATGGLGGAGKGAYDSSAGANVALYDAVGGSTRGDLYLSQSATGGSGGDVYGTGKAGAGGTAVSLLGVEDQQARSLTVVSSATGGSAGYVQGLGAGNQGGAAISSAQATSTVAGAWVYSQSTANGGWSPSGSGGFASANALARATATGTSTSQANADSQTWAQAAANAMGGSSNSAGATSRQYDDRSNALATAAYTTTLGTQTEVSTIAADSATNSAFELHDVLAWTSSVARVNSAASLGGSPLVAGALGVHAAGSGYASASMSYSFGTAASTWYAFDVTALQGVQASGFDGLSFSLTGSSTGYAMSFDSWAAAVSYFNTHDLVVDARDGSTISVSLNLWSNSGTASYAALAYELNATTAPVPEPETWLLWLGGLAAIGARQRRRQRLAA